MSRDDPRRAHNQAWPWTTPLDAELVRRVKAGERRKTIAHEMGRPLWAVGYRIDQLRELGLLDYRNRPWSPEETTRLLAARDAGARWTDLAPIFRRSRAALREHGLKARRAVREAAAAGDLDQFTLELRAA
jgi:hypothetical protein